MDFLFYLSQGRFGARIRRGREDREWFSLPTVYSDRNTRRFSLWFSLMFSLIFSPFQQEKVWERLTDAPESVCIFKMNYKIDTHVVQHERCQKSSAEFMTVLLFISIDAKSWLLSLSNKKKAFLLWCGVYILIWKLQMLFFLSVEEGVKIRVSLYHLADYLNRGFKDMAWRPEWSAQGSLLSLPPPPWVLEFTVQTAHFPLHV